MLPLIREGKARRERGGESPESRVCLLACSFVCMTVYSLLFMCVCVCVLMSVFLHVFLCVSFSYVYPCMCIYFFNVFVFCAREFQCECDKRNTLKDRDDDQDKCSAKIFQRQPNKVATHGESGVQGTAPKDKVAFLV